MVNAPNEVSIRSLKEDDAPMLVPCWEIREGNTIMSQYNRDAAAHEVIL